MSRARRTVMVLLLLVAAVSGFWVWQLGRDDGLPVLVGPPRSDYLLFDFDMVALDAQGKESFAASGPRLSRHPHLGTLDIEQPRFSTPDAGGEVWTSRADRAWVDAEGSELRMLGGAEVRGPTTDGSEPILLLSESLTLFPREQRVESALPVTVTQPGSILTAIGMRADLEARRVELLSAVRIRNDARSP